jgi:hypothetical protein
MSMADVPVIADGIEYWETQPATYDGVLGAAYRIAWLLSLLCVDSRWFWFWGNSALLLPVTKPPY